MADKRTKSFTVDNQTLEIVARQMIKHWQTMMKTKIKNIETMKTISFIKTAIAASALTIFTTSAKAEDNNFFYDTVYSENSQLESITAYRFDERANGLKPVSRRTYASTSDATTVSVELCTDGKWVECRQYEYNSLNAFTLRITCRTLDGHGRVDRVEQTTCVVDADRNLLAEQTCRFDARQRAWVETSSFNNAQIVTTHN